MLTEQFGWTPLHGAASNGHAPIVALLLATPGVDPLAFCVRFAHTHASAAPAQTRPFPMSQYVETPLDVAQQRGHEAAARLLMKDPRVAAALEAKAARLSRRSWGMGRYQ